MLRVAAGATATASRWSRRETAALPIPRCSATTACRGPPSTRALGSGSTSRTGTAARSRSASTPDESRTRKTPLPRGFQELRRATCVVRLCLSLLELCDQAVEPVEHRDAREAGRFDLLEERLRVVAEGVRREDGLDPVHHRHARVLDFLDVLDQLAGDSLAQIEIGRA